MKGEERPWEGWYGLFEHGKLSGSVAFYIRDGDYAITYFCYQGCNFVRIEPEYEDDSPEKDPASRALGTLMEEFEEL